VARGRGRRHPAARDRAEHRRPPGLPTESIPADRLQAYFGEFLAMVITLDNPTSSLATRRILGWEPTHPSLFTDFDKGDYFITTATPDNQ
jgi:hypothetical protein